AGIKSLKVQFAVEQTQDSIITGDGEARRLEKLAPKEALKNPDLKDVPAGSAGAVAAEPTEVRTPVVSAAGNDGPDDAVAKEPFGSLTALPLAYRDGGIRLMVQMYREGAPPAEPARFAWLVRGKDGKEASRSEETAGLQKVLQGVLVDRAVPVTPGDYDVAVVLLDAAGAVAGEAKRSVTVPATPTDFG